MALDQLVRPNTFKIAVLGEGGIGKTSLCKTYDHQQPRMDTLQTIAVEFHVIEREFYGEVYKLQVWDLGGQRHFKEMGVFGKYCRGIQGAVICFDLTDIETMFLIPDWLSFITDDVPMVLVGTKADLSESDDFIYEEIQQLIERYGFIDYIETSVTDTVSVEKVFKVLLARMTRKEAPPVSVAGLMTNYQ